MLLILLGSLLVVTTSAFHQNDYRIKHHRLEVISYNRKYLRNVTASLAPFNRTTRAFNASSDLLVDMQHNVVFTGQVYKFASNEYREFPARMAIDACKELPNNLFGIADILNYTNVRNCYPKKGFYYLKMYRPDETKFPPFLPGGDYKIAVNVTYNDEKIAEGHWYGSVQTIEKWLRVN